VAKKRDAYQERYIGAFRDALEQHFRPDQVKKIVDVYRKFSAPLEWISTTELCRTLGITSKSTMYKLIRKQAWTTMRLDGKANSQIRVKREDVEDFVRRRLAAEKE